MRPINHYRSFIQQDVNDVGKMKNSTFNDLVKFGESHSRQYTAESGRITEFDTQLRKQCAIFRETKIGEVDGIEELGIRSG